MSTALPEPGRIVVVEVGLPPPRLGPNARTYRLESSRLTSLYRWEARVSALAAMGPTFRPRWRRATASVEARIRIGVFPDPDNFRASLKAVWDGFQDACLLETDRNLEVQLAPFVRAHAGLRPGITIRIEERREHERGNCSGSG